MAYSVLLAVLVGAVLVTATSANYVTLNGRDVQHVPLARPPHELQRTLGTAAKRSSDADLHAINLVGCSMSTFVANVTVGQGSAAQTFQLVVDTGSSMLVVPSSVCTSCAQEGVTTLYDIASHLANNATWMGYSVTLVYGSGSANGTVMSDAVSFGGYTVPGFHFVAIGYSNGLFAPSCNLPSGQMNVHYMQGILGMAYAFDSITDSFPDTWEQAHSGDGLVFTMAVCTFNGSMWLNGYDESFVTSAPAFVPIVQNGYYEIELVGVQFSDSNGSTIGHSSILQEAGYDDMLTIVDSGTALMYVPAIVLADLNDFLNNNTEFAYLVGPDFLISTRQTMPILR